MDNKNKQITSYQDILDEVKGVLSTDKLKDNCKVSIYDQCISLYDVANVMKYMSLKYKEEKNLYDKRISKIINNSIGFSQSNIAIFDFNYEANLLNIGFDFWGDCEWKKIIFNKIDNKLCLYHDDSYHGNKLLDIVGNGFLELYDVFQKFKDFNTQSSHNITPINSNFVDGFS